MNLLKTVFAISSMTLVSRVLGFVRDTMIANVFGAGFATDAFFVAFKLPNLLRRIFAEGAFSQAFVPILVEYKSQRGLHATRLFVSYIAGMLGVVLFIISVLGIIAAPLIIWISAPGFTDIPTQFNLAVQLLRITSPYIFCISLASLAGSILNAWDQFVVPAFVPTLLNVSFIVFSLCFVQFFHPPILALAWATVAGGIAQLVCQLPALRKIGMLPRPRLDLKDRGVWRVIKKMGPAVIGVSVSQISLIINTIFASFLISGSVSWLYYADRLMEFPTGVMGVALGTILLPSLSRSYASMDSGQYSMLLDWGLRLCLLLALPASVGLAMLSWPLVTTLFLHGQFSLYDANMTQQALIAYAIGLVGLIVVKVLAPAFYARQDIKTPVNIAMMTLVLTQGMNIVFVWHLKHVGLALATSLGACLNAGLLYQKLRKRKIFELQPGWRIFIIKLLFAVLSMAVALQIALYFMPLWETSRVWVRCACLFILVSLGASVYLGVLGVLGFRLKDFIQRVR